MNKNLPSCCEYNFPDKADGCRCGKDCPERTALSAAWRYVKAYVPLLLEFRDHAAAKRAGHLAAITKPQQPGPVVSAGREPMSGEAKVIIAAAVLSWLAVGVLSNPDAINRAWLYLRALSPFII